MLVAVQVLDEVQIRCGPRCEVLWFSSQGYERVSGEAVYPGGDVIVALKGVVSDEEFAELRRSYRAGSLLEMTEFFRKKKTIAVVPDPPVAHTGLGGLGSLDDLFGGLSDLEDMLTDPGERAPTPMLAMERAHAPVQVISKHHSVTLDPAPVATPPEHKSAPSSAETFDSEAPSSEVEVDTLAPAPSVNSEPPTTQPQIETLAPAPQLVSNPPVSSTKKAGASTPQSGPSTALLVVVSGVVLVGVLGAAYLLFG